MSAALNCGQKRSRHAEKIIRPRRAKLFDDVERNEQEITRNARGDAAGLRRVVSECAGMAEVDYIQGNFEERSDEAIWFLIAVKCEIASSLRSSQ